MSPQSDYRYINNGAKADNILQEFPAQTFSGTVTNIAGSRNSTPAHCKLKYASTTTNMF